jgi:hypothetical protein
MSTTTLRFKNTFEDVEQIVSCIQFLHACLREDTAIVAIIPVAE